MISCNNYLHQQCTTHTTKHIDNSMTKMWLGEVV